MSLRSPLSSRCPESVALMFVLASCTLTRSDWEPEPVQADGAGAAAASVDVLSPEVEVEVEVDAGAVVTSPTCDGVPCQVSSPLPLEVTCGDGLLNHDESDMDCGGSCQRACGLGARCRGDGDCESGAYCAPETASCEVPSCTDGVKNGGELLVDCGGGQCVGCPAGAPCAAASDCESAVCDAELCAAASCTDDVENQDETDTDCGGSCDPCATGLVCLGGADCVSRVCGALGCAPGALLCCQAASCDDDVANGGEPFVDCGNAACGGCPVGNACLFGQQCATGLCQGGRCAVPPTCTDNLENGLESDTDCGGPTCPRCPDLSECNAPADCLNNNCDARGICISCGDATQNGTETDVDCGGADPFCQRCFTGQACGSNGDCASFFCVGGFCA